MRAAVAAFPRRLRDNPYCELLYDHLAEHGVDVVARPEFSLSWIWRNRASVRVLHLHWPELYYRRPDATVSVRSLGAFAANLLLAAGLGYRIVWTVHNPRPHEAMRGDRLARALLLRLARPVVHCAAIAADLPSRARAEVIPHGSYVGWYSDDVGEAEARRRLGLEADARVLLWFGQLRGYKGVPALLRAFHRLGDPRARLVVAGRPANEATERTVTELARELGDERIRLHLRRIADDEVQVFFRACDVVVLPYLEVATSGAAVLALSFGRGVVAPRLGCLRELEDEGCAIAYEPGRPGTLDGALARALGSDAARLGERAAALARRLGWREIAAEYARVFGTTAPTGRGAAAAAV